MKIQRTRILITSDRAQLDADDGHQIIAARSKTGMWNLLNEFSSKPTRGCHFDLRRQFINGLSGVRS